MPNNPENDKNILSDSFNSQNEITEQYSYLLSSCTTMPLRNAFFNLLCEEHSIQEMLFDELLKREWIESPPAQKSAIEKIKSKYSN